MRDDRKTQILDEVILDLDKGSRTPLSHFNKFGSDEEIMEVLEYLNPTTLEHWKRLPEREEAKPKAATSINSEEYMLHGRLITQETIDRRKRLMDLMKKGKNQPNDVFDESDIPEEVRGEFARVAASDQRMLEKRVPKNTKPKVVEPIRPTAEVMDCASLKSRPKRRQRRSNNSLSPERLQQAQRTITGICSLQEYLTLARTLKPLSKAGLHHEDLIGKIRIMIWDNLAAESSLPGLDTLSQEHGIPVILLRRILRSQLLPCEYILLVKPIGKQQTVVLRPSNSPEPRSPGRESADTAGDTILRQKVHQTVEDFLTGKSDCIPSRAQLCKQVGIAKRDFNLVIGQNDGDVYLWRKLLHTQSWGLHLKARKFILLVQKELEDYRTGTITTISSGNQIAKLIGASQGCVWTWQRSLLTTEEFSRQQEFLLICNGGKRRGRKPKARS